MCLARRVICGRLANSSAPPIVVGLMWIEDPNRTRLGPKQTDRVGRLSQDFLERIVSLLQNDLDAQNLESGLNRLFQFTYCCAHSPETSLPQIILEADLAHIVPFDITPGAPSNDVVARLVQTLNTYHLDESSDHQLIREASEMVTFEINVLSNASAGTMPELAASVSAGHRGTRGEVQYHALRGLSTILAGGDDRDTLEDLRGSRPNEGSIVRLHKHFALFAATGGSPTTPSYYPRQRFQKYNTNSAVAVLTPRGSMRTISSSIVCTGGRVAVATLHIPSDERRSMEPG
ncbi:hypothetical protein B0H17DRAFT_1186193 [Mycena rosella]|uniref:Uncharacterized protein n=1 Tax=Mycena rosella TaxID=1033263 RepID=A0AAD7CNA3_MYCRO|nr:hypothetical protein B0H17DRAFT_1186193 [Mycena rosella]